ncbi:MAG: hypothetical protein OEZ43_00750 [Gammaproteobacteria bacterium]|nr:hypothetical protein [Gammaproteobacteria bacterium]
MRLKAINIASNDWDNPHLLTHYYPEDLPEDWRLDYYANEFSAVWVPEEKWRGVPKAVSESWLEAVDGKTGFLFEGASPADQVSLTETFGELCIGFVTLPVNNGKSVQKVDVSSPPDCLQDQLKVLRVKLAAGNDGLRALRRDLEQVFPVTQLKMPLVVVLETELEFSEAASSVQILLELMGYTV